MQSGVRNRQFHMARKRKLRHESLEARRLLANLTDDFETVYPFGSSEQSPNAFGTQIAPASLDGWAAGVVSVKANFPGGSSRPSETLYSVHDGTTVLSFATRASDGFQSENEVAAVVVREPSLSDLLDSNFVAQAIGSATGDFDGDGAEDIIAFDSTTLGIDFGNIDSFYEVEMPSWTAQSLAKVMDVDANGLDELFVYHAASGDWELFSFSDQMKSTYRSPIRECHFNSRDDTFSIPRVKLA